MDVLTIEKPKPKKRKQQKKPADPNTPTEKEVLYAKSLNDRYDLNLSFEFFKSRELVRQLLHCFGFHKESDFFEETGTALIERLRSFYFYESSPAWIAEKLNSRIIEEEYRLTVADVEFMIEIINGSDWPLKQEDINNDPEDLLPE